MSAPFVSCECFLWEYLALSLVSNSWGYPRHFLVVGQRTSPGASLLKSSPALPSTGWVNLVQFYSVSQLCLTLCDPWTAARQASHHQLPELAQTHVCWVSDAIQPSCPLLSPSSAFSLSQHQGLFQWVHPLPKYWNFSFSISPSNECSGLIYFRIDWFDLPVVPGTFSSLLQLHSSKASIFRHSAFFMVQLSHLMDVRVNLSKSLNLPNFHFFLWKWIKA